MYRVSVLCSSETRKSSEMADADKIDRAAPVREGRVKQVRVGNTHRGLVIQGERERVETGERVTVEGLFCSEKSRVCPEAERNSSAHPEEENYLRRKAS